MLYSYLLVFYLVIEMSCKPIIENTSANVTSGPGLLLHPLPGVIVTIDRIRQVVTLRNRHEPNGLDESANGDGIESFVESR